MPAALADRILGVLRDAPRPLLAKEIAAALRRNGMQTANRKQINQALYGALSDFVKKDGTNRWTILINGNADHGRAENVIEERGMLTIDRAYGLLGVPIGSSLEEIKAAYRRKISEWHPDKINHMARELREYATATTSRLNVAYKLILESRANR